MFMIFRHSGKYNFCYNQKYVWNNKNKKVVRCTKDAESFKSSLDTQTHTHTEKNIFTGAHMFIGVY